MKKEIIMLEQKIYLITTIPYRKMYNALIHF